MCLPIRSSTTTCCAFCNQEAPLRAGLFLVLTLVSDLPGCDLVSPNSLRGAVAVIPDGAGAGQFCSLLFKWACKDQSERQVSWRCWGCCRWKPTSLALSVQGFIEAPLEHLLFHSRCSLAPLSILTYLTFLCCTANRAVALQDTSEGFF